MGTSSIEFRDWHLWADQEFSTEHTSGSYFDQMLAIEPTYTPTAMMKIAMERLAIMRDFQQRCIDVFRAALSGDVSERIRDWLLNDLPTCLREEYHLTLEDRHYTLPMFFRTDEGGGGKILEVQAPGSLWGDVELLGRLWKDRSLDDSIAPTPSQHFVAALHRVCPEVKNVQHMLDNSSGQRGMRYFIDCTRPALKYYGYDPGVTIENCQLIRSHSFYGLVAENLFLTKLARVGDGVYFDFPPHALFDQKACLVLPFWSETGSYFDDSIRDLLSFSSPVLPSGVELPDGTQMSLQGFSRLPRRLRHYYLKYAGVDTNRNWGSRSVFRLSNMSRAQCLAVLEDAAAGQGQKNTWLIQADCSIVGATRYIDRAGDVGNTGEVHVKHSSFFGPETYLGAIAQYRRHYKVHGQPETIVAPLIGQKVDGYVRQSGAARSVEG
ncbi:MAG: hypothetical protein FWH11_00655 [Micrococcales bacterium]|nr:hypothetical protein [Micrococcales bacterium]